MLKKIVEKRLADYSRQILKMYQPEIIAITGSVGKTTTKEAITTVMSSCFHVRAAVKNYNNEIGVPLTIIGADSPGRSVSGWRKVFAQAKALITGKRSDYPAFLILEMGVDRPGDMNYLTAVAQPQRAVLTRLGSAHIEYFKSLAELHAEKLKLVSALPMDGLFIYNFEDEGLRAAAETFSAASLSYGFSEGAEVRAENIKITFPRDEELGGITFKLVYSGSAVPVFIPGLIGRPALLAALAGAAVGFSYDMNALEVARALKNFTPPPGRLRLLAGLQETVLLDDTYNSSPEAVIESLETLTAMPKQPSSRVWAVLGDMKELGSLSQPAHEKIGELCAAQDLDFLVTVGESAELIGKAAVDNGLSQKKVFHFRKAEDAAKHIQTLIRATDIILVKGSQAVRLEKVSKALLADPSQASTLLVRQGAEWQ